MSLGLLVEGQSDQDTIPILAKRLGYDARIRARVVSRGQMLASNAISRYLTKFLRQSRDVTQVIICLDAERETPARVLASTRRIERSLNEALPVKVNYAVVDHALKVGLHVTRRHFGLFWVVRALESTYASTRKTTLRLQTCWRRCSERTDAGSERRNMIPRSPNAPVLKASPRVVRHSGDSLKSSDTRFQGETFSHS